MIVRMDEQAPPFRLDWELIAPPASGEDRKHLEARVSLEACYRRALESPGDTTALAALAEAEHEVDEVSLFKCVVVRAPRVEDDPDWESRVIDEYGDSDIAMEMEEYLEERRTEPDCESCPYANRYSIYPMDPCEFSAGGLLQVLQAHHELTQVIRSNMEPDEMLACAASIAAVVEAEDFEELQVVDTRDYLLEAIQFLRFWARHGFFVRATLLDEDMVIQAQAEMRSHGAGPTVH